LSDDSLIEEIFTLLFGGHETTSAAMAWTIYQVETHSEVKDCLLHEINSVLGKRLAEPKDLSQLPLARAIVDETLRISPMGPFSGGRIAQQNVRLSGYLIEAGTPILFCPFTMGQREDIWQSASHFDPSRFMGKFNYNSFHQPFGQGNRVCIGKKLAQLELIIILISLYQKTNLELINSDTKPMRRGLAWVPHKNLCAKFIKYNRDRSGQLKPDIKI
jgi:cytochrome P450